MVALQLSVSDDFFLFTILLTSSWSPHGLIWLLECNSSHLYSRQQKEGREGDWGGGGGALRHTA